MATKKKAPIKAKAVKTTVKPEVKQTTKAVEEPLKAAPKKSLKQFIQVFPQVAINLDLFEKVMDLLIKDGVFQKQHAENYRKGRDILTNTFFEWCLEQLISEVTILSIEEFAKLKIIISRLNSFYHAVVSYNKDGQAYEYVKGTDNDLLFGGNYFIYNPLRIFLQRAGKYIPELGIEVSEKEEISMPQNSIFIEAQDSESVPEPAKKVLPLYYRFELLKKLGIVERVSRMPVSSDRELVLINVLNCNERTVRRLMNGEYHDGMTAKRTKEFENIIALTELI